MDERSYRREEHPPYCTCVKCSDDKEKSFSKKIKKTLQTKLFIDLRTTVKIIVIVIVISLVIGFFI
ncbi:MAG: hypothetical protein VX359_02070 [Chloroflexota bacterium]